MASNNHIELELKIILSHEEELVFQIKKPKCHLDRDSRENIRFRWKNENPCLKNFSEVPGQKLVVGEVEESQVFLEVKQWKYKNGFFTMSSLDLRLSRTIFSFPIGWAKTKIFEFEDFGLEVERSQSVGPKISKWVFAHIFIFPRRTHMKWWNQIWMSRTHFINFWRSTNCQWWGKVKSQKDFRRWNTQNLKMCFSPCLL